MHQATPWIQKYRPSEFNDIILTDEMRMYIDSLMTKQGQQKNLILTGDPGVGKTTVVKCMVKHALGDQVGKKCLELNAAGDRGIKVLESCIIPFCAKSVGTNIVVLDEAENIQANHQTNIATTMKNYSETCRFIFICNDIKKIIEDVQSMCCIIRFKRLSEKQIIEYLKRICKAERIRYSMEGLSLIHYVARGDMRKAINELQKTAFTYNKIVTDAVLRVCNTPNPIIISEIVQACINKDDKAIQLLDKLLDEGYHQSDLANGFYYALLDADLSTKADPEKARIDMITAIYETKIALASGVKSKLQLYSMVAKLFNYE